MKTDRGDYHYNNMNTHIKINTIMYPELMLISPALAEEWLKYNTKNRKIKNTHVQKYCDEIESGEFLLTHHALAFSGTPNYPLQLLDGQHRLEAIIKSGRSISQWVFWNVPENVFAVLDGGVSRSFFDHHGWGKDHIAMTTFFSNMIYGDKRKLTKSMADHVMSNFGDVILATINATTCARKGMSTPVRVALCYTILRNPEKKDELLDLWRKMVLDKLDELPKSWVRCYVRLTTGDLPKSESFQSVHRGRALFSLAAKCMDPESWDLTKIHVDPVGQYDRAAAWIIANNI